jgi:hypothetical protein
MTRNGLIRKDDAAGRLTQRTWPSSGLTVR